MLKDFKAEWALIWAMAAGLKTGVRGKGGKTDIVALLDALKLDVASYQQCVQSFNTVGEGDARGQLASKIQTSADAIQAQAQELDQAFVSQIEANKRAPLGPLQIPQDGPAAVFNPKLKQLREGIHTTVSAMETDLIVAGVGETGTPPDEAGVTGVTVSAPLAEKTYTVPDWAHLPKTI